jgi:nitrogen regulatory protein PII-like uncharacterized protein
MRYLANTAAVFAIGVGVLSCQSATWAGDDAPGHGYQSCQTTDEATFRAAVEAITIDSLKRGVAKLDYASAVGDEWRRLDMGRLIDTEVDKAVAAVRDESSWGDLIQSLGSEEKATALTTAVAERVFRSDAMKTAIEQLANGVGRGLAGGMEIATSDAVGPAKACLEAFLGPRYGSTVAGVVTGRAGQEFALDAEKAGVGVSAGSVLRQSGDGITGAAILVMRRQLANMAQRIGTRIAGSILSRLVSVVAGGVGVVLIAKDVWDLRHGVLPIIAGEMKSEATKSKVKAELASTMSEQIALQMSDLGKEAAGRIVAIWRDFRAAHAKVLDLAERRSEFRAFLDRARPEALPRLDEVTALVLAREGESGVLGRLADGTLDEAVSRLPETAMEIARQSRSIGEALEWNSLAGPYIDKVLELELFRRSKPTDYTRYGLSRLVEIGDPVAVKRLAALDAKSRDVLFELDPVELKSAARAFDEPKLTALAGYMAGLAPEPRERLIQIVAASPEVLATLASKRVRSAILASRDQAAALDMMLRPGAASDFDTVLNDVRLAWERQIDPELIWHRHPILVGAFVVVLLVMLVLLRRLFYRPARARPAKPGTAA